MTELQMNITKWEGSDATGDDYETPEEGPAYCLITDAKYDKSSFVYTVSLYNLNTGKDIRPMRYTLKKAGEGGSITPNHYSESTLISIGHALFGQHVGVPFPKDIIGGVVIANIKLNKGQKDDRMFANIYKYDPVPAEMVEFGSIVQFSSDKGVVIPTSMAQATQEATE